MEIAQDALARLIDEAAIRDTTARFADTATRGDFEGFRRLWSEDAVWAIAKPFETRAEGSDAIVRMLHGLWNGKEFFVQFAIQGAIEIQGGEATASCTCHESARGPAGMFYRNHGVFLDRLRRSGDGWIFVSRSYNFIWLDTSPFEGEGFKLSAASAN